ncbi:MAG: hypothetical protein LBB90_02250 [Tannerella sp.]|nr:hypothetical protein [Tannerella sp.]
MTKIRKIPDNLNFGEIPAILRAVQFCALPVSIEKGIRPHAFFPVG